MNEVVAIEENSVIFSGKKDNFSIETQTKTEHKNGIFILVFFSCLFLYEFSTRVLETRNGILK